ncbi:cell division protein FtsQ/DivIB [candidate division KSB1 bacterium]
MASLGKQTRKLKIRRIRRFLKRLWYTLCTFAVLTAVAYGMRYWLQTTDVFTVKNIQFAGMNLIDEESIRALIKIQPEEKLYEVNLEPLYEGIAQNPYVASVAIGRRYPSTIKVDITERRPVAYLVLNKVYLVDGDGYLLPKLNANDLPKDFPIITGITPGSAKAGSKIDNKNLERSLRLLASIESIMPDLTDGISEIHNSGNEIAVFLSDNGLRIDFGNKDFEQKITKLNYFLTYHNRYEADTKLTYINLNYKDQIIIKEAVLNGSQ